jgi:flagellar assembly factor FliW
MGTYLCGKSNGCGSFTLDTGIGERTLETSANTPQQSEILTIDTTRFGHLTVPKARIITILGGMLGFPGYTRYVILDHDDDLTVPFRWLQSVENPALAFVIIDPWICMPDYAVELPDEVCESLQLSTTQPPLIFAVVTVPLDPTMMTANLQGPLVINFETRMAQQAVLTNSPYTTRHFILSRLLQTGDGVNVASRTAHCSAV